jgi:predicted transcriptional regulator
LERIWEEKHRLFKEGKIKKQKPLPAIKPEEVPFELPEGWEWVRLGNLSQIKGGFAFKSSEYTNDGVRVVRISDFDETGFKDDSIIRYAFSEDLSGFKIEIKDILMAMTGGTVGKSLLVSGLPEPMVINQRVALIRMFDGIISEYIYSLIRTNLMQDAIQDIKNSTNDNISMRDITRFLVPLPPLPEQQRIVTKLDQLMALCDELESNLSKSQAEGEKLMAAVVEGISGNRQESDARLCNPTNQIPDEVASSTNHKLSDTAPANLQLANTAHPGPGPSTAGYSNPESDKSKSNNTAAAILAYMQPGEQYTRSDIMDALNLTVSAWNTGIRELKEQGVVVQTGEKRGARYGLSDRERQEG